MQATASFGKEKKRAIASPLGVRIIIDKPAHRVPFKSYAFKGEAFADSGDNVEGPLPTYARKGAGVASRGLDQAIKLRLNGSHLASANRLEARRQQEAAWPDSDDVA